MTKEKISRLLKIQVSRQRNLSHISALEGAIFFLFVCLFMIAWAGLFESQLTLTQDIKLTAVTIFLL